MTYSIIKSFAIKQLIDEIKLEIKEQSTRWNNRSNNKKLISQGAKESLEWVLNRAVELEVITKEDVEFASNF